MSETICAHCGIGLIAGVDAALKNATYRREGFRPLSVKVHKNDWICGEVLRQRSKFAAQEAAELKRQSVWYRRLARRIRKTR